jgi:hypothetical protein
MIDLGLIAQARKAVSSKPREHVTPAILLAFVLQESSGVPYFIDTKPGSLYAANIAMAVVHKIRDKHGRVVRTVETGLTAGEVRQAIVIPPEIDGYKVPPVLVGRPAKFRFEYGYWKRLGHLPKMQRFRMASSWGLVQFMGPNIIGRWQGDGDPSNGDKDEDRDRFIQRFAADIPLQLLYAAGMIDELLEQAGGDVDGAYRGYNSGDVNSSRPDVIARAKAVAKSHEQLKLQLARS